MTMIIASLIMVLDKVRITNGALMMILGGSWRNESAGQGRQRVNTLTGGEIRAIKKSSLCSQTIMVNGYGALRHIPLGYCHIALYCMVVYYIARLFMIYYDILWSLVALIL